jgi:hypothetical protein
MQNLFKDIVLISALGHPGGMDSLHAPMLDAMIHREPENQVAVGFSALEFQIPHVAALSWEQIAEARTHPAVKEFRQRLLAAEETVRTMLPEASENEIRYEVGRILHRELIKETRQRMAPSGSELVGSVALQIIGGLIHPIGIVHTAVSVVKEVADWNQERKSWLAVLMKLSKIDRGRSSTRDR